MSHSQAHHSFKGVKGPSINFTPALIYYYTSVMNQLETYNFKCIST